MGQPKHVMICVSGYSGTGKDEFARRLVEAHGAVQTGLADPAKRHVADVYGFTEHQLFGPGGPGSPKDAGDLRYPKFDFEKIGLVPAEEGPVPGIVGRLEPETRYWKCSSRSVPAAAMVGTRDFPYVPGKLGEAVTYVREGSPVFWLSPREALQRYCELMNTMYQDTWIRKGIEVHRQLAVLLRPEDEPVKVEGTAWARFGYDRMRGVLDMPLIRRLTGGAVVTCFADFRHWHEIRAARAAASEGLRPVLVRIKRPSVPKPPYDHRSETEQATIPDSEFDFVVDNDKDVAALHARADEILTEAAGG